MSATLVVAQAGRRLTATTPLGGDVLVPHRLVGTEELSRPFLFTVDFTADRGGIGAAAMLGKPVGLTLARVDGATRHFHGLVRRFTEIGVEGTTGRTRYRAELVPWLWMLSLASDARTFEQMTALDIVDAVFREAGYADHRRAVAAPPPALAYVTQYGESNLAFVSRLLEAAGLYYRFEFAADAHTLVIADAVGSTIPAGAPASVPVAATLTAAAPPDTVLTIEREYAMHARSVALGDAHLLRGADSGSASSEAPGALGERYAFLGDLAGTPAGGTAADEARLRIAAEEATGAVVRGTSTCGSFTVGTRVTVTGGPVGADGVELHLTRVAHDVENGGTVAGGDTDARVENAFAAVPAETRHHSPRTTPRPSVGGTQTALVVGTGGAGQIDVDAHGRVLLQFPWDRGAGRDGASAHRVHLASVWAGAGWGAVQLPRIGQRVLVEFLDGDPDRPIVTGRVYSNEHAHPYALPADKTQSGIKSRSVGGDADHFNELRFEDKSGAEHVYLQAERDLQVRVKHDETHDVLHDRTTTVTHDDTRTVQEGNDVLTVAKGNQTVEITEGDQTTTVKRGAQTIEVAQGDQAVTVALGKQTVTVHGDQSLTVEQGNRTATVQMGDDVLAVKVGNLTIGVSLGNIAIKADVGSITLEALQGITLKSGPVSQLALTPSGVELKGAMVTVEGQGQATVKGAMVSVEGQAMAQVKGPMVQLSGDAMLTAKGAVTMIG